MSALDKRDTDFAILLRLVGMTPEEFQLQRSKLQITNPREFQKSLLYSKTIGPQEAPREVCTNCACAEHPNGFDDWEEGDDESEATKVQSVP